MGVTLKLAEFAVKTSFEDMPRELIIKGKERILDTIGCILAGCDEPVSKIVLQYVKDIGGAPQATVISDGYKTSMQNAALVNGTTGHALDFDDSQLTLIGHPSVVMLPVVLSIAEQNKLSGKKVLEAFLIGFEVACKIGCGVNPKLYINGWHATGAVGVLGAAAAAGKLLGLDTHKMTVALGIAASQACGLIQNFGFMAKPFHAGKASENGIMSAALAKQGLTAATNILEAPQGFCHTYSGEYELNKMIDHLGNPYDLLSPGVHTKPYPSCLSTHPIIEGTISLAEEHDIKAEDVEFIECTMTSLMTEALIHTNPKTALEGKFSAQFVAAISLLDRRVCKDTFTDKKVQDPRTVSLMKKVRTVPHLDSPDFRLAPMTSGSIVKIKMKDGREFLKKVRVAKGNPERPLSKDELERKFRDCSEAVIGRDRVDQSIDMIRNFDKIQDISQLIGLVSAQR